MAEERQNRTARHVSSGPSDAPQHPRRRRRTKAERQRAALIRLGIMSGAVILLLILLIVLMVRGFGGGAFKEAASTTLTIDKSGKIIFEELTTLDKEYYDSDEMKTYVEETISDYNGKKGEDSITLEEFKVNGDQVYLRTIYKTPEIYADFTNIEFKVGTVKELKQDGETFEDVFASVSEGKKGDRTTSGQAVKNEDSHAVVIRENVSVKVNGTIDFVSDENTELKDASTVKIERESSEDPDAAVTTYIVYTPTGKKK